MATGSLLLATGCCTSRTSAVQPSFAGVPHAIVRSPDYLLPLSAPHREQLLAFLASDGNRFQMAEAPPDAASLGRARSEYGALLDELAQRAPTPADLREGGTLRARFEKELQPMTIHDARIGWERGQFVAPRTADLTGLVKGNYVFAFYARRLVPPGADPAAPADSWTLAPKSADGAFTGLVVFHRGFAIPQPLR